MDCCKQDIRAISERIAAEVIKTAASEGNADVDALEAVSAGDAHLVKWVQRRMFVPKYASMAYMPPGIGE